MRDGIAADGILLIVEVDANLGGLAEILSGSVPREEEVPDKEHEVHEKPELDRPAVAGALRVFAGLEAEVESNGDQVSNVVDSGVIGGSCLSDDGVHDYQGGGLLLSDRGVFEPIGLEFPCEVLVKPGV